MEIVLAEADLGGRSNAFTAAQVPYASMYKTTGIAQTTVMVQNTPIKATVTTTAGALNMFTMPSANRLLYGGPRSFRASITGQMSGAANPVSVVERFPVYQNGSAIIASDGGNPALITLAFADNSSLKTAPIVLDTVINPGDDIEQWLENTFSVDDWDTWSFNLRIDFEGWV